MHIRNSWAAPARLFATVGALALSSASVSAQQLAPQASILPDDAADDGAAIIVTGVRGQARTVTDSPAPIDVIGGDKFDHTGSAELGDALGRLLPSFNFGANQAGVNSISRPVSNRGLGPAYTLVLVNSKRRHNSSILTNGGGDTSGANVVDFDLIPSSAIARVEVLKDSAAAQYGSDAIAGVVNVQLKQDVGLGGDVQYGELGDVNGDAKSWRARLYYGTKIGDGFLFVSGDYRKRGQAYWNTPAADTNLYGLPSGRTVAQVAASTGQTVSQVEANIAAANALNAQWNRDGAHNGDPQIHAFNLSYNAGVPVGDSLEAYSFGTYGERYAEIGNNFRRPNSDSSFSALFPNGYYPLNNTRDIDFQIVSGLKGTLGAWHIDLSSSVGRNQNHQYSKLTIRPSLGPTSPTSWPDLATFEFRQWTHNVDVTREFDIGLAKPIQFSFGAEYRLDRFRTRAGAELAWQQSSYTFQPGDQQFDWRVGQVAATVVQGAVVLTPSDEVDIKRRVYAGYVDLGINPTRNWYVGLAGRFEHYSDGSGNPVALKVNSRYEVSDGIAIRGTAGTGFRAPSLTQIAFAQTDGRTSSVYNPETGRNESVPSVAKLVSPTSTVGQLLGAKPLKAEHSWNAGLGLVLQPLPRANITIDGYYIKIKDRIARTSRLSGTGITAILAANGLSEIQQVEYFINAVDSRTYGLDIVADYKLDLNEAGALALTAAFNYNNTKVTNVIGLPSQLRDANGNSILGVGTAYFGGDKIGELEDLLPRTKLVVSANWTKGILGLYLGTTRYGSYWNRTAANTDDRYFSPKWITDVTLSVKPVNWLTVEAGATNIFNVRPDLNGVGSTATSNGLSYGTAPYHPGGGYYYGRLAFSF
ncbi:MAG: TonB-dependent receptor [Sphingobium sp.]